MKKNYQKTLHIQEVNRNLENRFIVKEQVKSTQLNEQAQPPAPQQSTTGQTQNTTNLPNNNPQTVMMIQTKLGVNADGKIDVPTTKAIEKYKQQNNLTPVDGTITQQLLNSLGVTQPSAQTTPTSGQAQTPQTTNTTQVK